MAETATIARPYAEAVFDLADKAGALAQWQKTLATMAQVAGNPEMQACISDPNVGDKALYDLVIALCKDKEDFPAEARTRLRASGGKFSLSLDRAISRS